MELLRFGITVSFTIDYILQSFMQNRRGTWLGLWQELCFRISTYVRYYLTNRFFRQNDKKFRHFSIFGYFSYFWNSSIFEYFIHFWDLFIFLWEYLFNSSNIFFILAHSFFIFGNFFHSWNFLSYVLISFKPKKYYFNVFSLIFGNLLHFTKFSLTFYSFDIYSFIDIIYIFEDFFPLW